MEPRDLSEHVEYVPGRGSEEVARDLGLDPEELVVLSSNENPFGPSPKAVMAVQDAAEDAASYPKAAHADLTREVADKWALEESQVWLSPGADGAIDYLSRAVLDPGDEVLVPDPGFSYYGMSARYHNAGVNSYSLRGDDEEFLLGAKPILDAYDGERIVYVTSPHNPIGIPLAGGEIKALVDGVDEDTLVVLDEAYGEFAETPSAARHLLQGVEDDNLAVLRTFSKAYGLAGLRIGYALVPAAWGDAYNRVSTPFAASELALRAASAALEDDAHVNETVETAEWAREYITEQLDAPCYDSQANFVLCRVGDATAVTEAAQERGVVVRDCSSFGLPGCIRISCGTEAETERAVETLNEVLADLDLAPGGTASEAES